MTVKTKGEPEMSPEERREYHPLYQRELAMEKIAADRESREKSADDIHAEAVKNFDYAYSDVTRNPQLLREVVKERQLAIEKAAKEGRVLDWNSTLTTIGEKVRQGAGLPTSAEQKRKEELDDLRESRGQKA